MTNVLNISKLYMDTYYTHASFALYWNIPCMDTYYTHASFVLYRNIPSYGTECIVYITEHENVIQKLMQFIYKVLTWELVISI